MKNSCHVKLWTTCHWLSVLILLALMVNRCTAMTPEQCTTLHNEAETYYYANSDICKVSSGDQMLIQHGQGIMHKVQFMHSWRSAHQMSEATCPYLGRRKRSLNLTDTSHNSLRTKRQVHDCTMPPIECDRSYPFRLADGSCNNFAHPTWGMANLPQRRLIPAAYDDGKSVPRSKSCEQTSLPSPRKISNTVHKSGSTISFHRRFTGLLAQFGQFVAHDLVLTPILSSEDFEPLDCCGADSSHSECFPIPIPKGDETFADCMSFSRSRFVDDCNGVRDQINSQSAAIDMSQMYGTSLEEQLSLREPDTGRLISSAGGGMLKIDENDMGCDVSVNDIDNTKCFVSGDERTNEQPGLTSMHTLWMREHNRIADKLAVINPHWDAEMLFQTTRKIVGAMTQHIVFSEWLPAVLGNDVMKKHGLERNKNCEFEDTYDPSVDLSIANSFSTATLRFGHSLLHNMIGKVTDSFTPVALERLNRNFFKTKYLNSDNKYGPEMILRWQLITASPMSDGVLEDSVRNFLFPDDKNNTLDLASLNIQRARDHGIPSYNEYREFCDLPKAYHFGTGPWGLIHHEPKVAKRLEEAYVCTDDIDLWTGMLSERKTCSHIMGPLQSCLMVEQFKRLKIGDRFWYERNDPVTGFTLDQLNEIRKVTMARVICDCTESVKVSRNVFWTPTTRSLFNRMYKCTDSRIKSMDLTKWKE